MAPNDLNPNQSSSEEEASGSEDEYTSGSESDEIPAPTQPAIKPQAPDPPSSESEESGSETESESDSDSPPKPISSKPIPKTTSTPPPAKSKRPPPSPTVNEKDIKKAKAKGEVKKASSSAKKAEGEEESGSDSPPKKPAVVDAKPIASKPMEIESKKEGTKTPSKRPAGTENEKDAKKAKVTDDDTKKQMFQRLWSEDDEIVILEGMIEYTAQNNGANALSDIGAFHEFVKKSLHIEVSNSQLADKIRRLKKKYMTSVGKEKGGKEVSFSKNHDKKVFELSKLIWGSDSNSEKKVTKGKKKPSGNVKGTPASASASLLKSNGVGTVVEKRMDISRFVQYGGVNGSAVLPDEIVKAGLELVDGPRRAELEDKWKKLMEQELVLYVKRMELLKEQAKLVLEAINSSGN